MIISEAPFAYYPDLEDLRAIYPDVADHAFVISLQVKDNFYSANIVCDNINRCLAIDLYNDFQELIQPRIRVSSGLNLIPVIIGYYLIWKPEHQKFIFGKGSEEEVL